MGVALNKLSMRETLENKVYPSWDAIVSRWEWVGLEHTILLIT